MLQQTEMGNKSYYAGSMVREEEKPCCMDVQVASVMKGSLPVTMTRKELTSRWNGIEIAFAYFSCILQVLERREEL